jgi:FkbM family methyltransferase
MPKQRLISYAQHQEDLLLFSLLHQVENGFYIDIGAGDPVILSATKLFYDRGWRGFNIEPLPEAYAKLCAQRPYDINLCVGIGGRAESLPLLEAGRGSAFIRNTLTDDACQPDGSPNISRLASWIQAGIPADTLSRVTPIYPLTDIVPEYIDTNRQPIHFCKIGVEGFEMDVLEGIDFGVIRPWVFAIESAIPNTMIPCHQTWEPILSANGYSFIGAASINRYYADEARMDLVGRSLSGDTMMREYEVVMSNPLELAVHAAYA